MDDGGSHADAAVPGAAATSTEATASAAPVAPQLREDQIQNAVAFLSHPKVCSIAFDGPLLAGRCSMLMHSVLCC
jgi:hypothetical protein